jgi:type 1 glutamine amidotransferase
MAAGALVVTAFNGSARAAEKIRVLILDGQNNHNWREGTPAMKWILESSDRFTVDVSTTPEGARRRGRKKKGTGADDNAAKWDAWRPTFSDYGVVILNYNGQDWPEPVRDSFLAYVRGGGGVVVVHAADNSFGRWEEYNKIIGLGGWGGRNEKSGPYVRWRDGKTVIEQKSGPTAGHGPQHEMLVETRATDHPITRGMPAKWRHAKDELYQRLRGPAENLTLLATAFADPKNRGSGENEPVMFTIAYGTGRIFHTVLGHGAQSMGGVGFQAYLCRGCEWAATGDVTIPPLRPDQLPEDKPAINAVPKDVLPGKR